MNEQRQQFANDFSESFRGLAHDVFDLKNPLDIVRSLVTDLKNLFVDEFVANPLVDFVKNNVGTPLSEKLITGTPGLGAALDPATLSLSTFTATVQAATTALAGLSGTAGIGGSVGNIIPAHVSGGGGFLGKLLGIAKIGASAFNFGSSVDVGGFPTGLSDAITKAGPIGDAFNIKLPGFATGGRPTGLSIVGERGPELFMPDGPGTIIPNHNLDRTVSGLKRAGGDTHHHYNITVQGAKSDRDARATANQIASRLRSELGKSVRQGMAA
jgi:hypothetical protein